MSPADVRPSDFDMALAATLARFIDAGYGPATLDATADFLLADAEFSALLRESTEQDAIRRAGWGIAA